MPESIEELVWKHAVINAYKHGGKASPKAVLGKLLAERSDLRPKARELLGLVEKICEKVSSLPPAELSRLFSELGGESRRREAGREELPPLPGAREGAVVTRFAPNPDSVLHLGSARAAILSHDYARMYRGRFILRFDDTDPRTKRAKPEMYDMIREDLEWLGCRWDEEHAQSGRLPVYYEYARKLIEMGKAYVCTCRPDEFRRLVSASKPCPCRDLPPEVHLERWEKMLSGEYGEGEAVLRVKTDLNHPNPAVRDWPAFRIIDTEKNPHPLVGSKYRVWPLYNWASAIDDRLMGVTHIFRGQEHSTNTEKQRYVYAYFGWEYPVTIHYGRLQIEGGVLSKSKIEEGIREGVYKGYDDPRLATLRALRRRGVQPEAIRRLVHQVGAKSSDAKISWENLLAINRKIIDPVAPRYFAVLDGVELSLLSDKPLEAVMAKHPQNPAMGERRYLLVPKEGRLRLLIERGDAELVRRRRAARLMGLANVEIVGDRPGGLEARVLGGGVEEARRAGLPFLHWVSPDSSIPVTVVMEDASERRGLAEKLVAEEKPGTVVQFERLFFARLDSKTSRGAVFYYTSR